MLIQSCNRPCKSLQDHSDDGGAQAGARDRENNSDYERRMALHMAQGLPMIAPSCHPLSQRQNTHKGKGLAPPEEHVQREWSSDEGELGDLSRAAQIAADAELCEQLQRAERQQAPDVSTTATASSEVVASAAPANNSSPSRAAPAAAAATATTVASLAVLAATGTAGPAQTLLPPGTYQPPLPWVMQDLEYMQYLLAEHQLAAAQHGEPRHFNAQGEPVNSRGKPYKQPPPAGRTGCNGGSHASLKKRDKEKAKRQQEAEKRAEAPECE